MVHTEWVWLRDEAVVTSVGAWLGRLHQLSVAFADEFPDIAGGDSGEIGAGSIRDWRDIHSGVMGSEPVDPRDAATETDPAVYGVCHSDINSSNYFFNAAGDDGEPPFICAFDWDQISRSWFLYDLAQPAIGAYLAARAHGAADDPPSTADVLQNIEWLIGGYESVQGPGSVDRGAFVRMLVLRRRFYEVFCRRAVEEMSADPNVADDDAMFGFCKFIVAWCDSDPMVECPILDALGWEDFRTEGGAAD